MVWLPRPGFLGHQHAPRIVEAHAHCKCHSHRLSTATSLASYRHDPNRMLDPCRAMQHAEGWRAARVRRGGGRREPVEEARDEDNPKALPDTTAVAPLLTLLNLVQEAYRPFSTWRPRKHVPAKRPATTPGRRTPIRLHHCPRGEEEALQPSGPQSASRQSTFLPGAASRRGTQA